MVNADTAVLRARRADLETEWARWVPRLRSAQAPGSTGLRPEVTESWVRSLPTVDPGAAGAPSADTVRWADSPLYEPVTRVADSLREVADDAGFIAGVTDERGTLLWTCGGTVMRRRAERVNFAPGGRWDEQAMGTNALSLALRTGRPSMVFSAEHLVEALHGWVCYCAPIRDADGTTIGVLDLSSTWDRSHPLAMSTVRSLVSSVEASLLAIGPHPGVRLTCLGAGEVTGVRGKPRPRQIEILTLLALEPAGFTPDRLRTALYGDRPVTATTLKAEVSHLRNLLDGGVSSRRYALTRPVECDAVSLLRALERGDVEAAVRRYRGPLLPDSEAPAIAEWRDHIDVAVRTAVLASGSPDPAIAYGAHAPYDAEVHTHADRLLRPGDPRRAIVRGRLTVSDR